MKDKGISKELIKDFSKDYRKDLRNKIISDVIIKNGINDTALNRDSIIKMQHTFSEEIKTGKITDQKKSGRCWLFAGLNKLRFAIAQKLNLFWDKLEKANYFLESIIETRREKVDSRLVMWLLKDPMQDGGQWDMFVNLVEKYGIVPQYIMPESFHSSDSSLMDKILNLKLREYTKVLREDLKGREERELRVKKEGMIKEFYAPLEFYKKYSSAKVSDYISIINAPTKDKPFGKTYTVKYLGNVKEGRKVLYLNLKTEELKKLAISQLKDGETVWFGCDVGQMLGTKAGIMDLDLYNYKEVLDTSFDLSKADWG